MAGRSKAAVPNRAKQREATFRRLGSARRIMIGGAVVLTATLTGLVDSLTPGKASVRRASAGPAAAGGGSSAKTKSPGIPPLPRPATAGQLGLARPAQAPAAAPPSPAASGSSGGSTGSTGSSAGSTGGSAGSTGSSAGSTGNTGGYVAPTPAPAPVVSGGS